MNVLWSHEGWDLLKYLKQSWQRASERGDVVEIAVGMMMSGIVGSAGSAFEGEVEMKVGDMERCDWGKSSRKSVGRHRHLHRFPTLLQRSQKNNNIIKFWWILHRSPVRSVVVVLSYNINVPFPPAPPPPPLPSFLFSPLTSSDHQHWE